MFAGSEHRSSNVFITAREPAPLPIGEQVRGVFPWEAQPDRPPLSRREECQKRAASSVAADVPSVAAGGVTT